MPIRAFGALKERFVRDALLHGRTPLAGRTGPPNPDPPLSALWTRGRLAAKGFRMENLRLRFAKSPSGSRHWRPDDRVPWKSRP